MTSQETAETEAEQKSLLRRAFAELAARGLREVRLGVDAENPTGAVALYEDVGMSPLRVYDTFELGTPEAVARRC